MGCPPIAPFSSQTIIICIIFDSNHSKLRFTRDLDVLISSQNCISASFVFLSNKQPNLVHGICCMAGRVVRVVRLDEYLFRNSCLIHIFSALYFWAWLVRNWGYSFTVKWTRFSLTRCPFQMAYQIYASSESVSDDLSLGFFSLESVAFLGSLSVTRRGLSELNVLVVFFVKISFDMSANDNTHH